MPPEKQELSTDSEDGQMPLSEVKQVLEKEAPGLWKAIPADRRDQLVEVVQRVAVSYQGPLPPAGIMSGWEKLVPGTAKRFFEEFFAMGKHGRECEAKLVGHSIWTARLGQIFAFILGLGGLAGGVALCAYGNNIGGLGIAGASLTALVTAFLKGVNGHSEEKPPSKSSTKAKPKPSVRK